MSELPEFVRLLINGIASNEGFTEFTVDTQAGSNHGDNFVGVVVSIIISGTRSNFRGPTKDEKLYLICKLPPDNEERRKQFQVVKNFKRETLIYSKILPLFEEFQREKGLTSDEGFFAYPKCYATIADEKKNQFVIIMEDLRQRDFIMWPKQKPTVVDNAYLTMEKFAKLHAVSFALKDQRPETYNTLKNCNDFFHYLLGIKKNIKIIEESYDRTIRVLENEKHVKILEEVKTNFLQYFKEYANPDYFEPFGVINHGDSWNNNIMYQYKEGKLVDVCLIDWQQSRFGSTAMDLAYNIFTSTDKSFRDKEYKNLIQHYYQTLSKAIYKLGSDPTKLYTFDNLQSDLKKYARIAFMWTPMLIQIALADSTEVADLDELGNASNEEHPDFIKEFDTERQLIYNKRINDVFTDLVEYGYYWN